MCFKEVSPIYNLEFKALFIYIKTKMNIISRIERTIYLSRPFPQYMYTIISRIES